VVDVRDDGKVADMVQNLANKFSSHL
jgi:hypothetical protein